MIARPPKICAVTRFFPRNPVFILLLLGAALFAWANWGAYRALPADPASRLAVVKAANLPDEIEAAYRQLLDASPADVELHYAYIQNHFETPAVKRARQASPEMLRYYRSLSASPQTADLGWFGLGLIETRQKNYQPALQYFAHVADRRLKYLNLSTGQAQLEIGLERQAEASFRAEIAAGGDVARAVSSLASLYQQQGRRAELFALLGDPQYAAYVQFDDRRHAALQGGDMAGYLQLSLFGPWGWFSLPAGLLALFTGAVWVMYFGRLDLLQRVSSAAALGALLLGALLTPSVFILRDGLAELVTLEHGQSWSGDLAYALLHISLVEELVKLLPALLVAGLLLRTRQPFDWLLYGSLGALGFAAFENALYFSHFGFELAVSRFLYSMPLHLAATSLATSGFAACSGSPRPGWACLRPLAGFTAAVWLHGSYDFFVMDPNGKLQVYGGVLLLLAIYAYSRQIRRALSGLLTDPARLELPLKLDTSRLLLSAVLALLLLNFGMDYARISTEVANQQLAAAAALCLPALLVVGMALGRIRLMAANSLVRFYRSKD